jgi:hypothetical protein
VGAGHFSPRYRLQTGSGGHPASYPMGTGESFPGVKAGGGGGVYFHEPPLIGEF